MTFAAGHGKPRAGTLVHHVPGRARIKVSGARDDAAFFDAVYQALAQVPGVRSVRVNPKASSIVVVYSEEDRGFMQRLLEEAAQGELLEITRDLTVAALDAVGPWAAREQSLSSDALVTLLSLANQIAQQSTASVLDLKLLLPLVAGYMSLRSLGDPKRGTPLWVTLAIFAFNSFATLHRQRPHVDTPPLAAMEASR